LPPVRKFWGGETNGVKAGVYFQLAQNSTNQTEVFFVPTLLSTQTNEDNPLLGWWVFPPIESRYRMELTDQTGKPVKRTKRGNALGRPYVDSRSNETKFGTPGLGRITSTPNGPEILWEMTLEGAATKFNWLSLKDYFEVNTPGRYHFRLQVTLFSSNPGSVAPLAERQVLLPPVEADLDIKLPARKPPD
jgi:hypothetical protein